MNTVVAITGASSGIGAALARRYAHRDVMLVLMGRDAGRLEQTRAACLAKGATVQTGLFDLRDRDVVARWLTEVDARNPIDIMIASAGVLGGRLEQADIESDEDARSCLETNIFGTLNALAPVLQGMRARRRGQVAILSSLAAFSPLPDAPAYSAAKAALLAYGLALREVERAHGLRVSVICPGHVDTPMSRRETGWRPFEIDADDAALRIVRAMRRDTAVAAFPFPLAAAARLSLLAPEWLRRRVFRTLRFSVTAVTAATAPDEPAGSTPVRDPGWPR